MGAFTDALARILDHPEEAREMGRRGRERVASCHLDTIITLHDALYEEALRDFVTAASYVRASGGRFRDPS